MDGDDIILCQITTEARIDDYSIVLTNNDFKQGSLNLTSIIRPNRLFTADKSIILYKIGSLKESKIIKIHRKLLPASKDAGLVEFSFDSEFLGCQKCSSPY